MSAEFELDIHQRLERIELQIAELREDWKNDLGIIFASLRVIGLALDVQHKLDAIVSKLETKVGTGGE